MAIAAIALTLSCTDDPPDNPIVAADTNTAPAVCVIDTLRMPLRAGGCPDLEYYFHTAGVLNTLGDSYDAAASGTHAYVCDGPAGLAVVDIADPARPEVTSVVPLPGGARDAVTCGDFVFVASAEGGLIVIDASNPSAARSVAQFDTPGLALSIVYEDEKVFLADDAIGMMIFDVSDPMRPQPLGVENTPGSANGVDVEGRVALVSDSQLGLRVVSVVDPDNPWLVGSVPISGQPSAIAVDDGIGFVASGSNGLVVLDISRPDSIVELTTYDTPGTVLDVAVADGIAYLADGANGLLLLDVTIPGAPELIARSGAERIARGVSVMGSWVLAADSDAGFRILDASNVLGPPITSSVGAGGSAVENLSAAPDGRVYSLTQDGVVTVVEEDAASRLIRRSSLVVGGTPGDAMFYEGFLYVANGAGITIIDPTSPDEPKVQSIIPIQNAQRFAIYDSTLYIGRGFNAGVLYDLKTSMSMGLTISAGSVSASPDNGYFAQLSGRVWLSAPKVGQSRPLRNVIEGNGSTRDIEVRGDFLFVGKHQGGQDPDTGIIRSAGIEVFDISNPLLITRETFIETSIAVERFVFDGNLIYVAGRGQGLEVIDVSDIHAPRIVGTFSTATGVYKAATFDGAIYVAAGTGGLLLLGADCSR